MATLMVRDASLGGQELGRVPLEFPTERITVRELIFERVYQEVKDREVNLAKARQQWVSALAAAERELNGQQDVGGAVVDWRRQAEGACEAFAKNAFFILVGERQAEGLDEVVDLGRGVDVSFVRLTPLVGG
jgi:hypothetical protein